MTDTRRGLILRETEVRTLLSAGTVTIERTVKPQPPHGCAYTINGAENAAICTDEKSAREGFTSSTVYVPPTPQSKDHRLPCPYGAPGDTRFVRETWAYYGGEEYVYQQVLGAVFWKASYNEDIRISYVDRGCGYIPGGQWRSSLHMPAWASRIDVKLASVNVSLVDGKWKWHVRLNVGARRDVEWISTV